MSMPAIYSALGRDEARNAAIFDDVLTALEAGRCPLIRKRPVWAAWSAGRGIPMMG
jgi:hypothetical protein